MKNVFKMMGIALMACTMFVACGDEETTQFTITVNVNDATMGTVSGGGVYDSAATATLTATANEGYEFANWSDGVEANPRTITVTKDETYTANFVAKVTTHADVTFGTNTTWAATFVGAGTYNNQFIIRLYKDQTSTTQPSVYMVSGKTVGTIAYEYIEGQGSNGYSLFYFNYDDDYTTYNGNTYPTWQTETYSQTITAIDMNAQTFTFTSTGSVWSLADYVAGNTENPTVNALNTDVESPWETINFSKSAMPKAFVK